MSTSNIVDIFTFIELYIIKCAEHFQFIVSVTRGRHYISNSWFGCSGRIPRLSLNQHSLYVGVVEKPPPPPLRGEQYGKMEPKYPEGGHCQSVLRLQGVLTLPLF